MPVKQHGKAFHEDPQSGRNRRNPSQQCGIIRNARIPRHSAPERKDMTTREPGPPMTTFNNLIDALDQRPDLR